MLFIRNGGAIIANRPDWRPVLQTGQEAGTCQASGSKGARAGRDFTEGLEDSGARNSILSFVLTLLESLCASVSVASGEEFHKGRRKEFVSLFWLVCSKNVAPQEEEISKPRPEMMWKRGGRLSPIAHDNTFRLDEKLSACGERKERWTRKADFRWVLGGWRTWRTFVISGVSGCLGRKSSLGWWSPERHRDSRLLVHGRSSKGRCQCPKELRKSQQGYGEAESIKVSPGWDHGQHSCSWTGRWLHTEIREDHRLSSRSG